MARTIQVPMSGDSMPWESPWKLRFHLTNCVRVLTSFMDLVLLLEDILIARRTPFFFIWGVILQPWPVSLVRHFLLSLLALFLIYWHDFSFSIIILQPPLCEIMFYIACQNLFVPGENEDKVQYKLFMIQPVIICTPNASCTHFNH